MKEYYLPAEWHTQNRVQLTWPHQDTDWAYMLEEVTACFVCLAREIASREPLLIVTPDPQAVQRQLMKEGVPTGNITFITCPTNDTWARDHALITLLPHCTDDAPLFLDFCFNGWGLKFAANLDNRINARVWQEGIFKGTYCNCLGYVLEGGSIESDGKGTLLTTSRCLLSPNRNGAMNREEVTAYLTRRLGIKQILWIEHGYLAGDDTDSHIDTLARFCPEDTIVYVQCTDPKDEHYAELASMEEELRAFRTLTGKPYRLLPLPLPDSIHDEHDERLPATYANFLIMNGAVLFPTYNQPANDRKAAEVLRKAFPEHEIVGIDCRALIRQHGSLHCVTMQYPATD